MNKDEVQRKIWFWEIILVLKLFVQVFVRNFMFFACYSFLAVRAKMTDGTFRSSIELIQIVQFRTLKMPWWLHLKGNPFIWIGIQFLNSSFTLQPKHICLVKVKQNNTVSFSLPELKNPQPTWSHHLSTELLLCPSLSSKCYKICEQSQQVELHTITMHHSIVMRSNKPSACLPAGSCRWMEDLLSSDLQFHFFSKEGCIAKFKGSLFLWQREKKF